MAKKKLETSNSRERTTTDFQPGGTATLITNKWITHKVGRWSYVTLKGLNNQRVMVISAYQVCGTTLLQAGPSTCWKQQWRFFKKK
eukprot:10571329-Ditylum_brightwellii.AAC.1